MAVEAGISGLEAEAVFLTEGAEAVASGALVLAAAGRQCRGCGCTDGHACAGGCSWVEADLCSACVGLA